MADLFTDFSDESVASAGGQVQVVSQTAGDEFLNSKSKAKDLTDQLNWIQTQRKSGYLNQALQLRSHKSVQVRRKLATIVGFLGSSEHIPTLQEWQIAEADRQVWLLIESAIDRLRRGVAGEHLEQTSRVYTVSEALAQIKRVVSENEYTIEGEVSEVRAVRQMYYFAIKEGEDTRIDCWAFAGKIVRAGFPLNEGLSVRIHGKFKISKFSKIYFDIDRIELTGEGELLRNLQLLEDKLRKEGVFDIARKRTPKALPDNILLIASETSAAISDFLKVLGRRRGGVTIYHLPIKTQGVGAEYEILQAFEAVPKIVDEHNIDTIVMTRGGGSKDDLIVFNSEKVVRGLYSLPCPTIVAIGHERDTSLAELAADVRASTPSQAAELVSRSRDEVFAEVQGYSHYLSSYFQTRISQYRQTAGQLWLLSSARVVQRVRNAQQFCRSIDHTFYSLISQSRRQVDQLWSATMNQFEHVLEKVQKQIEVFDRYPEDLLREVRELRYQGSSSYQKIQDMVKGQFQEVKVQLSESMGVINLSDPHKVLDRGFAMVWQDGKVVEQSSGLKSGQTVEIEFRDGKKKL
jgi:exodeoxyribonuclease VII large subunit